MGDTALVLYADAVAQAVAAAELMREADSCRSQGLGGRLEAVTGCSALALAAILAGCVTAAMLQLVCRRRRSVGAARGRASEEAGSEESLASADGSAAAASAHHRAPTPARHARGPRLLTCPHS